MVAATARMTGRECDERCSLRDIPRARLRTRLALSSALADPEQYAVRVDDSAPEIKLKLALAGYGGVARPASSSLLCQALHRIVTPCEGKPAARRGRKATGPKGVPDDSGVAAVKASIVALT
jgi:hypothetical protein